MQAELSVTTVGTPAAVRNVLHLVHGFRHGGMFPLERVIKGYSTSYLELGSQQRISSVPRETV